MALKTDGVTGRSPSAARNHTGSAPLGALRPGPEVCRLRRKPDLAACESLVRAKAILRRESVARSPGCGAWPCRTFPTAPLRPRDSPVAGWLPDQRGSGAAFNHLADPAQSARGSGPSMVPRRTGRAACYPVSLERPTRHSLFAVFASKKLLTNRKAVRGEREGQSPSQEKASGNPAYSSGHHGLPSATHHRHHRLFIYVRKDAIKNRETNVRNDRESQ